MTVRSLEHAQRVYTEILDELRLAPRCAVVLGLESEVHILRIEAVDSWLHDPSRRQRFLFVADCHTTLGDVEWLLSR